MYNLKKKKNPLKKQKHPSPHPDLDEMLTFGVNCFNYRYLALLTLYCGTPKVILSPVELNQSSLEEWRVEFVALIEWERTRERSSEQFAPHICEMTATELPSHMMSQ